MNVTPSSGTTRTGATPDRRPPAIERHSGSGRAGHRRPNTADLYFVRPRTDGHATQMSRDDASVRPDEGPTRSVRQRLARAVESLRGSTLADEPYRPGEHGRIVEDRSFDGERIEAYWLNAPFSYAVITHDDEENEHRYYAVEPDLDRFERDVLDTLYDDVRVPLLYADRKSTRLNSSHRSLSRMPSSA